MKIPTSHPLSIHVTAYTMYALFYFFQAVTGHEECVEALLQHGAKPILRDCRGRTPIHLSAACGHIGVLGALLQSVASGDAVPALADNHGYTSLHWACYNGKWSSGFSIKKSILGE